MARGMAKILWVWEECPRVSVSQGKDTLCWSSLKILRHLLLPWQWFPGWYTWSSLACPTASYFTAARDFYFCPAYECQLFLGKTASPEKPKLIEMVHFNWIWLYFCHLPLPGTIMQLIHHLCGGCYFSSGSLRDIILYAISLWNDYKSHHTPVLNYWQRRFWFLSITYSPLK